MRTRSSGLDEELLDNVEMIWLVLFLVVRNCLYAFQRYEMMVRAPLIMLSANPICDQFIVGVPRRDVASIVAGRHDCNLRHCSIPALHIPTCHTNDICFADGAAIK